MLTLLNAEHALIATDQLVYTAEETTALLDMLSRSEQVSRQAENMNSEMEKSFEATRTEGFQAGFAEGRAKATEELSKQLAVLHEKTEHQSDQIRQQCIDLALEIVRRIGLATGSPQTMADLATHAAAELLPGQRPEPAALKLKEMLHSGQESVCSTRIRAVCTLALRHNCR